MRMWFRGEVKAVKSKHRAIMQSYDKKRADKPMDVHLGCILWSLWVSSDKHFKATDFYIGNECHQCGSQRVIAFF